MNNILVVNINWLGDAIFSTPVFKALKEQYPQAKISCLCVPRVKEVLVFCPEIDEIIVYDEGGRHRFPWAKLALIAQLRQRRFDIAFLLHRSMTRALLVWMAGIPVRVGYSKSKALLTHAVDYPGDGVHRCDVYLAVLEAYGLKVKDRRCQLSLILADTQSLDKKLAAAGIGEGEDFLVFNCGGNWDLKRWPKASWAKLAEIVSMQAKVKVIFAGGGADKVLCAEIISLAVSKSLINLAGDTGLGESLALYKRARAVVSADSGPLHLAHSVGASVVAIFGPTRPEITGPRGVGVAEVLIKDLGCNKNPCYHLVCANNLCMQSITVDDVWQALKKFLN